MKFKTALQLSQAISVRPNIISYGAGDVVETGLILFSKNGVVALDDDTRYKVTITGAATANAIEVHNLDNSRIGQPIIVQKGEVRGTQTEKTENYPNVDLLCFDDILPLRLTHLVDDSQGRTELKRFRKVEISTAQMSLFGDSLRIVSDDNGTFTTGLDAHLFPISQINALTIHHDTSLNSDLLYYTVDFQ
jgi:hypothetical protein